MFAVINASVGTTVDLPPIDFDGCDGKFFYFTAFYNKSKSSIVTGPYFTKRAYEEAIKYIQETGQSATARFNNIGEMLAALRHDLGCILETAE